MLYSLQGVHRQSVLHVKLLFLAVSKVVPLNFFVRVLHILAAFCILQAQAMNVIIFIFTILFFRKVYSSLLNRSGFGLFLMGEFFLTDSSEILSVFRILKFHPATTVQYKKCNYMTKKNVFSNQMKKIFFINHWLCRKVKKIVFSER